MGGTDRMIIANLTKRQYIDPDAFNDNTCLCDYMIGSHARAIAILVCEAEPGTGSGPFWKQYASLWSRDRIVAINDYDPPNTYGVETATSEDPERNLFSLVWNEFEGISYPMLNVLSEYDREFADDLLARTWITNLHFLWHIGNTLKLYPSLFLERAVAKRFGPDWKQLYEQQDVIERRFDDEDDEPTPAGST